MSCQVRFRSLRQQTYAKVWRTIALYRCVYLLAKKSKAANARFSAWYTRMRTVAIAAQAVRFCIWSAGSTIENLRNRLAKWEPGCSILSSQVYAVPLPVA